MAEQHGHYWLFLVETAKGNSDKFKEILADGFAIELSANRRVGNWAEFDAWLKSMASQITTSTHAPKNLQVTDKGNNTLQVSVDFDWRGVNRDGKAMVAETHHEWVLTNNMDERFARLKRMAVTTVMPFQVVD